MTATLTGFGALFALLFAGMPLAFAMAIIGFVGFALTVGFNPAGAMSAQIVWDNLSSYSLSVLPLFVLMGNLINHAGLSADLYNASNALIGHRKGGLAMATILASGGFAAVSGSSLATAATMSSIALPSMRRYRYHDSLSSATVAAGGTLGILIPPSVIMVIYGTMTETSIAKLFMAGIIPGILGVLFYLAAVRYVVWRRPEAGPAAERMPWAERLQHLRQVWAIALLFLIVMGGIYIGMFTATEAAGIGATGAFVIALFKGGLSVRVLFKILANTARTTAMLMAVLLGALIFANFINVSGVPSAVVKAINGLELSPYGVIFALIAFYIVLGSVFDELAMILLTIPLFFPLVMGLGFDPIWFGIVIVMVVEIGLICPPIGMNLFIIRATLRDVPLTTIFRGIVPFVIIDVLRLALIVFVPWLVLALPSQMTH